MQKHKEKALEFGEALSGKPITKTVSFKMDSLKVNKKGTLGREEKSEPTKPEIFLKLVKTIGGEEYEMTLLKGVKKDPKKG